MLLLEVVNVINHGVTSLERHILLLLLLILLLLLLHHIVHSVPATINILLEVISDQVLGMDLEY